MASDSQSETDGATTPLYQEDAYLTECAAKVSHVVDVDGSTALLLDQTVFYPTGGGQPGDVGRLSWEGGDLAIAATIKGPEPGQVLHILGPDAVAPPTGAEVVAALDWERRHRHMRMHTALHLLSVVIPHPVTGGQIGAEKGRLDFDLPDAPGDREAIEESLNALIAGDHAVGSTWITDAELDANPGLVKTMSVKPPTGQGHVRLVRIGSESEPVDLQPCGGTHVRSTGEIGRVAIGKIEKKGKRNRRVNLLFAEEQR